MEANISFKKLLLVDCIPPCKERKAENNNRLQTYCVDVKRIEGVKEGRSFENHSIQAILFDQKYGGFIGSFWVGQPVEAQHSPVIFNQKCYFYTSIPVSELSLVIELITSSKTVHKNKTCGWLQLPLVEVEEEVTYKLPLIKGTPLFLLTSENNNLERGIKLSDHNTGMEISISLSYCPALLKINHLFPENIIIDPSTKIPGLVQQPKNLDDDDFIFEPHLQKCITFVLERLCVRMQSHRIAVEKEILQKVQAHFIQAKPDENLLKADLIQRRLQVSVHNGYGFIQEPDFYNLLVEPLATPTLSKTLRRASSLGSLNISGEEGLVLRSDIRLPKIPDDPNISIIFLLEYVIALEKYETKQLPSTSFTQNPMCEMAVAWGFCQLSTLKENPSQSICLSCDPTLSPHKIKFLKLSKGLEITFSAFSLLKQNKDSLPSYAMESHVPDSSPSKSDLSTFSAIPRFANRISKRKSVADIPMSVEDNGNRKFEKGNTVHKNENSLVLQEVTLLPSSLPLIPPMLHYFPGNSGTQSGAFSKLYWDKLPPVLNHQGKPAFNLDASVPYKVEEDIEFHAAPQTNEYMFNFVAISCLDEFVEIPCEVFFTFQFYRFLPIKTESLALKQLSEKEDETSQLSFVFTLHRLHSKDKGLGFQVTYNIDPMQLNQGEYRSFISYLLKQTLHIDLWNAQSLLYFGTALLPLKYFCRQGKEAITTTLELDIINCEFPDESLCQNSVPIRKSLGKLHVNLGSVRHPLSTKALEKYEGENLNADSIIIYSKNKNLSTSSGIVSKARPIAETDRELSKLLSSKYNSQDMTPNPHVTEERRRKLARMEAVRNLENNKNNTYNSGNQHFFKEKQRDLLSIESYIQKNKTSIIHSLLYKFISSEKLLCPVIGAKTYFEFVVENPFPIVKEIEIIWKCPELSLVNDIKLWQKLRNMHNVSQKCIPLNFGESHSQLPTLLLQPGESVHVPFIYQGFSAPPSQLDLFKAVSGHHFSSEVLSSTPLLNMIQSSVKIRFMTDDKTLLAVLNLKIQPLPASPTHVFKFLSMEQSMFKKSIQINKGYNSSSITLKCSDPSVICTVQENHDSEENMKILIKAPTKSAGKCTDFFMFAYEDKFQVAPFQIWSVSVCPLQRIDLSCVAGQLMRSSLLIRGTHATNLVRCFSSSQDLQLDPNEPFMLSPFAVQELSMNIRPLLPGIKHFQITMINQSQEQILQSWLLVLSCQKPSVSKAFQIHLSIGKETAKRITYTNPYHQERSFILYCSHPHLLALREYEFSVPSSQSYSIGLYFLPQSFLFSETIFLYVNDTSDKNEETYCIKVICQ